MQGAADAAALAGSVDQAWPAEEHRDDHGDAQYEAQRNGLQNGVNGVMVTVNAPPTSGANTSTSGAVEVIVTKSQSFVAGRGAQQLARRLEQHASP